MEERTELEKVELIIAIAETLFQMDRDLKDISSKDSYASHRELLAEVGKALIISTENRIKRYEKKEKERRDSTDETKWEQDDEIRQLVEELRNDN